MAHHFTNDYDRHQGHSYHTRSKNQKYCEVCREEYALINEEHSDRYHRTCPYCISEIKKTEYEEHFNVHHPYRLEIVYSGYAENLSMAYKESRKDEEVICDMKKNEGGNVFTCKISFMKEIENLLFYFIVDNQKFRVANNFVILEGKPKLNQREFSKGTFVNDAKLYCSGYTYYSRIGHTLSQYSNEIGEAGRSACTPICCGAVKYLFNNKNETLTKDSIQFVLHEGVNCSQIIHSNIEVFNNLSRNEKINVNEHLQTGHVIRFCHEMFNAMITPGFKQGVISSSHRFEYVKDLSTIKDHLKDSVGAILTTKNVSTGLVFRKSGQLILFDPHSFDYGDEKEEGASFLYFANIEDLQEFLMERYPPLMETELEMFNTYEVNILIPSSLVKDKMKAKFENFLQKNSWVQDTIQPFIEEEFRKKMKEEELIYDAQDLRNRASNHDVIDMRSTHNTFEKKIDIYEELAYAFKKFGETHLKSKESMAELCNFLNNNINYKELVNAKAHMLDYVYNKLDHHFIELCKNVAFRNLDEMINRIKMLKCFTEMELKSLEGFFEFECVLSYEHIERANAYVEGLKRIIEFMLSKLEIHNYIKKPANSNIASTSNDVVKIKSSNEGNWRNAFGFVSKMLNLNGNNKSQDETELDHSIPESSSETGLAYPIPKSSSETGLGNITREYRGHISSPVNKKLESSSMDLDSNPRNNLPNFPNEVEHPLITENPPVKIDKIIRTTQVPQGNVENTNANVLVNTGDNIKAYDNQIQPVKPGMIHKKQDKNQHPEIKINFWNFEQFMKGLSNIYDMPHELYKKKLPLLACIGCREVICEPIKDNMMIYAQVHSPDCKELWYAFGCPYSQKLWNYGIIIEQNLVKCKKCNDIIGIIGRLRKEKDCMLECRKCENKIYPTQNQYTTVISDLYISSDKFQHILFYYQPKVRLCFKRD